MIINENTGAPLQKETLQHLQNLHYNISQMFINETDAAFP